MIQLTATESRLRSDALAILVEALKAADAREAVLRHFHRGREAFEVGSRSFPYDAFDRVLLLSIGKAAVPMAQAVEEVAGVRLHAGLVVTKHGHSTNRLRACRIFESGHPIPDSAGVEAAHAVKEFVRDLSPHDLLLVCVSGGASALLPSPPPSITLAEKQQTTDLLLRAGADIRELNLVRKQLSTLKGGRLAALAYPATVVGLLLSDVIGDDTSIIGSGLTVADVSTPAEAFAVLSKFTLLDSVPPSIPEFLMAGILRGAPLLSDKAYNVIVGSNRLALAAAADGARRLGYETSVSLDPLQGEARVAAPGVAHHALASRANFGPCCWLTGGETTVTVSGNGLGGRNQEFALAAALAFSGEPNILLLSAGTDGTDGPTDAAGAFATGTTVARGRELALDAHEYLARNDSFHFFEALGDLVRTGPSGTNVMDICITLAV